jgi:hypothetical protein
VLGAHALGKVIGCDTDSTCCSHDGYDYVARVDPEFPESPIFLVWEVARLRPAKFVLNGIINAKDRDTDGRKF